MISFIIGVAVGAVGFWAFQKYWTKVNSLDDIKEVTKELKK